MKTKEIIDSDDQIKVTEKGKQFHKDYSKINELIQELHLASCFVCPSIFEPWGLVVNEALSASLPVIASRYVGASFDLIRDKNTGFIANDMNDFGDKMLVLYNNTDLLLEFSDNALSIMHKKWNYTLYLDCLN